MNREKIEVSMQETATFPVNIRKLLMATTEVILNPDIKL
jgi:hypothetical protein